MDNTMDTIDFPTEEHQDEDEEDEEFNFEIQKMTDDADAILDSIRREALGGGSSSGGVIGKRPKRDEDDMTDDGSLDDDLKRQMMAELMAAELMEMDDNSLRDSSNRRMMNDSFLDGLPQPSWVHPPPQDDDDDHTDDHDHNHNDHNNRNHRQRISHHRRNDKAQPNTNQSSVQATTITTCFTWMDKTLVLPTILIWWMVLYIILGPHALLNEQGDMTLDSYFFGGKIMA